ncbi:armadillo-type protein [Radiomyces spectabilis]|uniref:armadillo-type protein n=1 Tax=Radiomyces spectabilis TaxID=64574 RepID=UPI0022200377|nr:armadillo-type protein [Radiomyces spectabilis]KAI8373127.1 armadillo-type protein [Radiomyces spectabilis]
MSDPRSQLLHVLHEAASQDFARMRQAEELLIQWENEPSFFATLQDIFYDRSVDHDVRFLGGIYLKNGINRFWRKTAKNPINPAEKANIRQRLLNFFDEPSTKLTWQNALIAARIARLDYPREWPELLPTLMQVIETTDLTTNEGAGRLIHDRALTMLYEVLYELSGRILSTGRRQFAEIAPRTFQTVAGAYMTYSNRNFSHLSNLSAAQQDGTVGELNITSMCVKCMRILMVSGIKDVHQYEETKVTLVKKKHALS